MSIQNLLKTAGWKEVEQMMEDYIVKCNKEDVSENLNSDTFKINTLANRKAAKKLKAFLRTIKLKGGDMSNKGNISYK